MDNTFLNAFNREIPNIVNVEKIIQLGDEKRQKLLEGPGPTVEKSDPDVKKLLNTMIQEGNKIREEVRETKGELQLLQGQVDEKLKPTPARGYTASGALAGRPPGSKTRAKTRAEEAEKRKNEPVVEIDLLQ